MTIKTALQQDYAFTAVDDYNTRMYILPYLLDEQRRKELISEHKNNPLYRPTQPGKPAPIYSRVLVRLVDKLRVLPTAGKQVIVETEKDKEYTIGLLPVSRGGEVVFTDEKYPTRGDAEHAIFLKRLKELMMEYKIDVNW